MRFSAERSDQSEERYTVLFTFEAEPGAPNLTGVGCGDHGSRTSVRLPGLAARPIPLSAGCIEAGAEGQRVSWDAPVSVAELGACRPDGSGALEGWQEVIRLSDTPHVGLAGLTFGEAERLVAIWAHRYQELGATPEARYVFLGERDGAFTAYATPFLPVDVKREWEAAGQRGECTDCGIVQAEVAEGSHIVAQNHGFVAIASDSSAEPYTVRIYTRKHKSAITDLCVNGRRFLAQILQIVTARYLTLPGAPRDYAIALYQQPTGGEDPACFHFRAEVGPA